MRTFLFAVLLPIFLSILVLVGFRFLADRETKLPMSDVAVTSDYADAISFVKLQIEPFDAARTIIIGGSPSLRHLASVDIVLSGFRECHALQAVASMEVQRGRLFDIVIARGTLRPGHVTAFRCTRDDPSRLDAPPAHLIDAFELASPHFANHFDHYGTRYEFPTAFVQIVPTENAYVDTVGGIPLSQLSTIGIKDVPPNPGPDSRYVSLTQPYDQTMYIKWSNHWYADFGFPIAIVIISTALSVPAAAYFNYLSAISAAAKTKESPV